MEHVCECCGERFAATPVEQPPQEHLLFCGDSTNTEHVARLMGGKKGRLLATDPPYGVDFKGGRYNPTAKRWEGIEGDKRTGAELSKWKRSRHTSRGSTPSSFNLREH